jgi:quercetin dioxygenase-like cupin family protein
MNTLTSSNLSTRIISEGDVEVLDVFGPSIAFLVAPQSSDEAPCVMRGTIPSGVSVPLHSHAGIESFFIQSGKVEVFSDEGGKPHWITAGPGEFIEVPDNAKHAFRNASSDPVVQLIITTSKLGHFFQEIGRPLIAGKSISPPSSDEIQRFVKIAGRHSYWLATPEENAGIGITLF